MKLHDVMREIGEICGIPEETIQRAFDFANASAGQGKEIKAKLDEELTDEDAAKWKAYGLMLIQLAVLSPEFRHEFMERAQDSVIRKN